MRSRPSPGLFRQAFYAGVLVVGAFHAPSAIAADWRYCLALSPGQHTVYMSTPFADEQSMEATEAEFGQALDRANLRHDTVQCPLGDAQSIAGMKSQAIQYNQANGNKVVQFDWRP
jgi:hypothetical protein